jgi:molybdate/tungstate transport system ATP-binding protein
MLRVKNLFLKEGDFTLGEISFEVDTNSYFVILGKTGSGKTMLLESIAGLRDGMKGKIYCNDDDITYLAPEKRNFGFVYQDFMLFPNMSVEKNIKYSARFKKITNEKELFDDLINFLHIKELLKRDVKHLSGGEKQRVAIARAIYSRPKLLLLDEPLSAVDPTFRSSIMKLLKNIASRYKTTVVHVTHNFKEASFLADRIAVMLDGKILQIGKANDVLNNPKSIEVAKFLGFKNVFKGSFFDFEDDRRDKYFSVDPNRILFSYSKSDKEFCYKSKIESVLDITDHYKVFAKVKKRVVFAKVPKNMFDRLELKEGKECMLCIDERDIRII